MLPSLDIETEYSGIIIGVDEAGRGPWAGPVVAAAVNLWQESRQSYYVLSGINDSKKLSAVKRQELFSQIIKNCDYGVGIVGVDEIDDINILEATKKAMAQAVANLSISPNVALIDGNQPPKLDCKTVAIIKGDSKSLSIAAASIIAKVTRDNIMFELDKKFPQYSWSSNQGYGTKAHQKALAEFGVTEHHRKSYAPIKKILQNIAKISTDNKVL